MTTRPIRSETVILSSAEVAEFCEARALVHLGLSPDEYAMGRLRLIVADGNLVRAEVVLVSK